MNTNSNPHLKHAEVVLAALRTCQSYYKWAPNDKSICGDKVLEALPAAQSLVEYFRELDRD